MLLKNQHMLLLGKKAAVWDLINCNIGAVKVWIQVFAAVTVKGSYKITNTIIFWRAAGVWPIKCIAISKIPIPRNCT